MKGVRVCMEMFKETEVNTQEQERQEPIIPPEPPKKGKGGVIGLGAAGVLALLLVFGAINSGRQTVPVMKSDMQSSGGRIYVTETDASGSQTYQAPCVFPSPKNGTVTVFTPDPKAEYWGEISIGHHRVSGTVTQGHPVIYHTDSQGDLAQ